MDERLWPDLKKTIRGVAQGPRFEETYIPSKDIYGNYTVDVTYGFAAGQDPARAIVALLQLRGDQLVSRDFVQRQLPMDLDVVQLQVQIDNEQFTDALKQGIQQYMASILVMAQQGQDPTDALTKMGKLIELRGKGSAVHDAVLQVFKPPPQAHQSPQDAAMAALHGASSGSTPAPGTPGQRGPPSPAQAQPGAMDMQRLLAGLFWNRQATTSRQSGTPGTIA